MDRKKPDPWRYVEGSLKEVIHQHMGVHCSLNDRLIEDIGVDSLDAVELVMVIEEKFEVEIPDNIVEEMITVWDILRALRKHKEENDE